MSEILLLQYDTLPPRSRLRREVNADGSVSIIAPAGEPGALARRSAMFVTAWSSALVCVLITAAIAIAIGPAVSRYVERSRFLFPLFLIAIGVFFSALFLLAWSVQFRKRMDELARVSTQLTGVRISPRELHVETSGPLGDESSTIGNEFDLRLARVNGSPIEGLAIRERGGATCLVFAGLSNQELRWIASEIVRGTSQPPPTNVTIST